MTSSASPDVVVIGAGITGASVAFHLSQMGVKTTLIERHFPASGPTGRSSAVLHAFYLLPELSQLGHRGTEILRHLEELTGGDSGFTEVGTLWVCGQAEAAQYSEAVQRIRGEGVDIEGLPAEKILELVPGFDLEGVAFGAWEPTAGYADPSMATNSMVEGTRKHGGEVLSGTAVHRLLLDSGRVKGVEIEGGERIYADVIVVAAGPWTRSLVAQVGVDLPLHAERHTMAVVHTPGAARDVMPVAWVDDVLWNYARPDGQDLVLVGTWPEGRSADGDSQADLTEVADLTERFVRDPDEYAESSDDWESSRTLSSIARRVPSIADYGVRPGYAGLYDMSPDDLPIHSWVPGVEGLFVCAGTSGHGFKLGPAVGEEVARAIVTGGSRLLAPFRADRFNDEERAGEART